MPQVDRACRLWSDFVEAFGGQGENAVAFVTMVVMEETLGDPASDPILAQLPREQFLGEVRQLAHDYKAALRRVKGAVFDAAKAQLIADGDIAEAVDPATGNLVVWFTEKGKVRAESL